MPWTIKGYALDRRPPEDRNKSLKTKVEPDLTTRGPDPLMAARKLVSTLESMSESERREFVRYELIGPDPEDLLGPAPQDPGGEPAGPDDAPSDTEGTHE